jgi:SAM-dependent methyltransferase
VPKVEFGAGLAAVARRNLAGFPLARVVVAAFEDWPLPPDPFDAVVAATAFHWIDPPVRVAKAAAALRPGGALAVIATHHVAGGHQGFFAEVQDCCAPTPATSRWRPTPKRACSPASPTSSSAVTAAASPSATSPSSRSPTPRVSHRDRRSGPP